MALQTANQYGLGIDGVGLSNRLLKIMQANKVDAATAQATKAEALQQQLKTTGAQLLHIRNNIEGKEAQKKAIANLATEKINQGQDSGIYDELLNIDDPDLLNTRMTQIIIRATDADKQLEKGMKQGGTKVLAQGAQLVDEGSGDVIAENTAGDEPVKREMKQDVNGRWRYTDNKELVFTEVDKKLDERDPDKTFAQTKKLRDEFTKATDEFAAINNSYTRVISSAEDPSPAGDMALIFNYMKILDPGSAVREAEFRTAGQAGNLPTQVQQAYNKLAEGQLLTASMRKDFVNRAGRLYTGLEKNHKKREKEYIRIADSFNLDPSQVIVEQSVSEMPVEETGPIGEVEEERIIDGKIFQKIGGKWYGIE